MIRLLLVDDHPLVRTGLRSLLETTADLSVVAEAANGDEAIEQVRAHIPDVVLMDLSMPGLDGVAATRRIVAEHPASRVVVLTSFAETDRVRQAVAAGAVGYVLKDSAPAELLAAVRAAADGQVPLDPRIAGALLPSAHTGAAAVLSAREKEVLLLTTKGMSNKQIGRALGIAEHTVKVHLGNVFRRLGVADRTSAALWARQHLAE